jgi:L-ascorbate metabolism protein UlaG (beta-lactamase superfamily)
MPGMVRTSRVVKPMTRIVAFLMTVSAQAFIGKAQVQTNTVPAGNVTLTYFGTAGWEIAGGSVVILVDPYLSRLRIIPPGDFGLQPNPEDQRPAVSQNDVLITDTATIDRHIQRADFILLTHSHVDHIMDAPYIARKTGATVVGHQSSINVMRASGLPEAKLLMVRGGEDYEFGKFSVKVIPSLHSPLFQKQYFNRHGDAVIPSTIRPPFKLADLSIDGGSLAYLVRIEGHQILIFGSMNYIEREVEGLRPDVVMVGAGASRAEIHDYAGRLMRALGFPMLVLATHWDNYFLPFDASQDEYIRPLQAFTQEVYAASPRTRVILPKYFQPIALEPAQR